MKSTSVKIAEPPIPEIPRRSLFNSSRLKLYRARRHAYEVSFHWESAIANHDDTVGGVDLYTQQRTLLLQAPAEVSLALGDAIRNLRSALDYLVSSMARAVSLPDDQTIFPFAEKASRIKDSFRPPVPGEQHRKGRRAGALYELSRHYPDLESLIVDQIKPHSADYGADALGDTLWRIITSDNVDKHRLMTPTVQWADVSPFVTSSNIRFTGSFSMRGDIFRFPAETKFEHQGEISADIFFKEPTRLAGKPITATLVEGCDLVGEVIELFEAKFKPPQRAG